MFILLMGPPGAGKGTQAELLTKKYNIAHIATGDMFRAAVKVGTPMGLEAKKYMDEGQLVPDDVTIGIVKDRLSESDAQKGFILDGFPRTTAQAVALDVALRDLNIKLDSVINIEVPIDELVRRISGRLICRKCGRSYHKDSKKPQKEGVCDVCQGELYQRDDDKAETVKERLDVYTTQTKPLIDYYKNNGSYVAIDGSQSMNKVFEDIVKTLEKS